MVRYLFVLVLCFVNAQPPQASAQAMGPGAAPEIRIGVRPARVRLGETFVVTVRVTAPGWPDEVILEAGDGADIVEVRDRVSAGVGPRGASSMVMERDFLVRALAVGRLVMSPVTAAWGSERAEAPVPVVEVAGAGLAWVPQAPARERRRELDPVRGEGVPPTTSGRTGVPGATTAWPSSVPPNSGGYLPPAGGYPADYGMAPGTPLGPSTTGWGVSPDGSPWAMNADAAPWWEELIPRVERYEAVADDPNGLVRLEAGVAPPRVYEGQQVTVVATATFAPEAASRMAGAPEFVLPRGSEVLTVEVPYAPPIPAVAGRRMQEAHSFMRAFFPVRTGPLTLEGPRILYSVGAGGLGRPPMDSLTTGPLTVEVLPVPRDQAPPGWTGAVGRYSIRASLTPARINMGESSFLVVEVNGIGHVPSLRRPEILPAWGAELRPTGEQARVEVRDGVVGGTKTFSWLIVPLQPGPIRIGPILFPYFDPWVGGFGQVGSQELTLEVGGA